ncbi:hypothetical protein KO465_00515 [Candidatus Micrarchaeota archaeon]|nr:hypothetical protein [Candidatus Micrarchaeota archaeon]
MAVISSDVDSIIATLKKYKYLSLDELSKYSNLKNDVIQEWLPVLEDSGYVKIVYQFTKIYIQWLGQSGGSGLTPTDMDVGVSGLDLDANVMPESAIPKRKKEVEAEDIEEPVFEQEEVKEPEFEEEVEEPVFEQEEVKEPIVKKEISEKSYVKEIPKIDFIDEDVEKASLTSIKKRPMKTLPIHTQEIKKSVEEMLEDKSSDTLSPYAQQLKEYLADIDAAKRELEELRKEKNKLYTDIFEPMEKEFRAGYTTIAERIAEKQKNVLELQEQALKLPEMLEEVDRQQIKLHEIGEKIKKISNESTGVINNSLESLQDLSEQSAEQMQLAKKAINKNIHDLSEAQTLLKRIESVETEISESMVEIEDKVREEQDKLERLADVWREIQETKDDVVEKIKESSDIVDEEKDKLRTIEEQVSQTLELREWIKMSQEIYKRKVDDFDDYLKKNEKDYNKLRESIEANYLKMYMKDLADLSKEYESALSSAKDKEKTIDERIDESKKRISDLVRQSQELVEALEKGEFQAEDFNQLKREMDRKRRQTEEEMEILVKEREQISGKLKSASKKKPSSKSKKNGKNN